MKTKIQDTTAEWAKPGSQQRVVRRQWSKWLTLTVKTCNRMAAIADDENSHLADALWGAASSLLNARDIIKQMPPNDKLTHGGENL